MFEIDPAALRAVALRTVIVYVALLVGIRLFGKRELGQMAPFDLVVVLLLANSVQNAMVGSDSSVTAGLLAAFCLLATNYLVSRLGVRSALARRVFAGEPVVLVNRGEFVESHMAREGLSHDQILEAVREHGVKTVRDAELAVLEVDGTISVVPMDGKMHRTKRRVRGARGVV